MRVFLSKPDRKYEGSWQAALREFEESGVSGFWNVPSKPVDIGEYLRRTEDHARGLSLPDYWMPATTFWLIDGGEFMGHANVRHTLVEWSTKIGGHIGFAIRPSAWRKGYGRKILELALPEAKRIGLSRVLLTCNESNLGSRRIIEGNGGGYQDTHEVKGELVRRYWIAIG